MPCDGGAVILYPQPYPQSGLAVYRILWTALDDLLALYAVYVAYNVERLGGVGRFRTLKKLEMVSPPGLEPGAAA